jgi:hypothetical protein
MVANETYFGRGKDIKLGAWAANGRYHFGHHSPKEIRGILTFAVESIISFDDKVDAKKYLEDYFSKSSSPV